MRWLTMLSQRWEEVIQFYKHSNDDYDRNINDDNCDDDYHGYDGIDDKDNDY